MMTMDWYSWLSKTNLDPYLIYEYGRTFTHNELQRADAIHFNHEFLQSMGITVAKHRLEILKLAKKNARGGPNNSFSKLISAIIRTRMLLTKKIGKCVYYKQSGFTVRPDPNPVRPQWPDSREEMVKRTMKSGPLDRRVQESYMSPKRVLSISGPLDRRVQENMMVMYNSPMEARPGLNVPGSLDDVSMSPRLGSQGNMVKMGSDDVVPSLWSLMFHDMKPT